MLSWIYFPLLNLKKNISEEIRNSEWMNKPKLRFEVNKKTPAAFSYLHFDILDTSIIAIIV